MAYVELVIKISEDSYKANCNERMLPPDVKNVVQGIRNGTPLPKGHGRLIDVDKLKEDVGYTGYNYDFQNCLDEAQTIIEADIEGSEEA